LIKCNAANRTSRVGPYPWQRQDRLKIFRELSVMPLDEHLRGPL
jgi:hypothetical protein